jgi:anhydro-N-acetylmuramic acid kinase
MKKGQMIVAGVMSGTSADGINVALVRMGKYPGRFELIGHTEFSYSKNVRAAILGAMSASHASVADLARLNFLLGELYADSVLATQKKFRAQVELIGCHGQTLYHQGGRKNFLGRSIAATWQTGEGAIIAARTGVPVVSDLRPADIAAGGKGAPLVPFLDYLFFRDRRIGRIVQNIGGIANLTAIPAGAVVDNVIAFDTGPGNMVIDAVTEKLFGKSFDRGGKIAASGKVIDAVIRRVLRHGFFRQSPPRTAGREEFGREFVRRFLQICKGHPRQDVVATATALTAHSIADAISRYVMNPGSIKRAFREMVISGGGTQNTALVSMLKDVLGPLELRLRLSDEFGLPSTAKEAVAFAVLAYETWHRRASNIPSATGSKRPAVLGKISYP